ncbi:retinol dehydrogenase 11-like [Pristis pectinata]|uniref:retinol dehydrogenase 11-like n=1 Tax=Pristis pectinata TaxID=685728 RepID=UPI00223E1AFF|nr:retinol dehydrogenase 11-like [Pristis pectinata]
MWFPWFASVPGIGRYIAQDLAQRNARVILACRSEERGRRAEREIRQRTGNGNVHLRILDTSSMESVRKFAERIRQEEKQLHILVNNAGASGLRPSVTPEGLELTFATNHLGPFLLTNLLLGLLKESASARVINVSSMNHRRGQMVLRQLQGEDLGNPQQDQLYNNSKLMNILFTRQLSCQLRHTGVTVNAVHPGVVMTEAMRYYGLHMRIIFNLIGFFFFKVRGWERFPVELAPGPVDPCCLKSTAEELSFCVDFHLRRNPVTFCL